MLRRRIIEMAAPLGVEVFIPPLALCTDNAAMAGIALPKLAAGQVSESRHRRIRRARPTGPRRMKPWPTDRFRIQSRLVFRSREIATRIRPTAG